jgi:hypothetical protein
VNDAASSSTGDLHFDRGHDQVSLPLETLEVEIDGRQLHIEGEAYIGLSVTGPADLIDREERHGERTHERFLIYAASPNE